MLFAYAERNAELGDPAFVQNPLDQLLSKSYAATIRQKIPIDHALDPNQVYRTPAAVESNHTTHYTIVDRQGNLVSVTYTLNRLFGAGVIAGQTGFFLNDEMDDFTAKPSVANSYGLVQGSANGIAPLKRPLSSMAPTILLKENQPVLATGSPSGATISTTVLQVILCCFPMFNDIYVVTIWAVNRLKNHNFLLTICEEGGNDTNRTEIYLTSGSTTCKHVVDNALVALHHNIATQTQYFG